MFEVKDVKVVRAKCRGIGGIFNCFKDKGRGEWSLLRWLRRRILRMIFLEKGFEVWRETEVN